MTWSHLEVLQQFPSYSGKWKSKPYHKHPVKKADFATIKGYALWIFKIKLNLRRNIGVMMDSWLVIEVSLTLVVLSRGT